MNNVVYTTVQTSFRMAMFVLNKHGVHMMNTDINCANILWSTCIGFYMAAILESQEVFQK
jgi:hypothetical protein